MTKVTENRRLRRFELAITDQAIAAAYYKLRDGRVVLVHTAVPPDHARQGFGSLLAAGTLELLRASGRKAVPQCSFMTQFVLDHPEFTDVIAG